MELVIVILLGLILATLVAIAFSLHMLMKHTMNRIDTLAGTVEEISTRHLWLTTSFAPTVTDNNTKQAIILESIRKELGELRNTLEEAAKL